MNQFDFFGIDDTIIDVDMPKPSRFRSALGSCAFAAGAIAVGHRG